MCHKIRLDVRSMSPHRQPAWRWHAAQQAYALPRRIPRWEHPIIADTTDYLRSLSQRGAAVTSGIWPALSAAHAINKAGGITRHEIEARLLTGEPTGVIAKKTGVAVTTITAYEAIFFNVAHCLQATNWIISHAINIIPGQPATDGQIWKYLAYAGGAVILDLMIDDFLNRPVDPAFPDRSELAAKGRYIVREFAAGWDSIPAVAELIEEGCKLFPHVGRGKSEAKPDKILAVELQFLRLAVGLAPLPEHSPVSNRPPSGPKDDHHENKNTAAA